MIYHKHLSFSHWAELYCTGTFLVMHPMQLFHTGADLVRTMSKGRTRTHSAVQLSSMVMKSRRELFAREVRTTAVIFTASVWRHHDDILGLKPHWQSSLPTSLGLTQRTSNLLRTFSQCSQSLRGRQLFALFYSSSFTHMCWFHAHCCCPVDPHL